MGMYDDLRVEAALPDAEYQGRTFQTKSLGCGLSTYTITSAGRLVLRQVQWEAVPEEERPLYGTEVWERGGLARISGSMRERLVEDVVLDDFHDDIIFYDTVNAPNGALYAINFQEGTTAFFGEDGTTTPFTPVMVYYKARFSDGWLQWIRRISQTEADAERGGWW